MKYFIAIFFTLLICANVKASDYIYTNQGNLNVTRNWDNLGKGFMLNTLTYGVMHKVYKLDRGEALLISTVTTIAVSTLLALSDSNMSTNKVQSLGMNAIGVALSAGCIFAFDF